ncbi:MAG: response regulator transcription factor [Winogradskyella sp.]|uniref:LytR/AlgR family response regulator transcription factor n=1 Tax=Winogradskyella sp. TaxID=1883156 RepID=UPI0025E9A677|nr:LytTR family DNA-binding domain-containing protein [Winogradskyella sp.]NRB60243.1 response regulator transcription factor [Winogradskyella sp.]
MNCIIIDDEPLAIDVIESYCNAIGSLNVSATFTNAIEALQFLSKNTVDLVFTDIEMPNISGIDFIKSLEGQVPYFIFTTAYSQYALEGFDMNATDYLVKPIPFPRFITAINRVRELKSLNDLAQSSNVASAGSIQKTLTDDFIFIKSEYENLKVNLKDIKYIQGLKDYLKLHIEDSSPILTLMNFKQIQEKLPEEMFLRIHRSYIINVEKIESIQKNKVVLCNERIPIGESFKSIVYSRFGI